MWARICRAVVDLSGEEPAKASLLKCIGNVLIMTTIEQIAEAHVFAEKSGLGTKHLASLIETMFQGRRTQCTRRRWSAEIMPKVRYVLCIPIPKLLQIKLDGV